MALPIPVSLSEGYNDNKPFDESNEAMTSEDVVDGSKIKSRSFKPTWTCSGTSSKARFDIDAVYAITQLKKEGQTVNVYNHLQGILNKLLTEKPLNPVENFEKYSMDLKRSYINREVNFQRVFVNNVHQSYCLKSLQMCKCALKKQSNKRNQYESVVKRQTLNGEKTEVNSVDGDGVEEEVRVQNLWEANNAFNKAGCGLPPDQVALISLTMNALAQVKRYKSIRFWGKIFGLKNPYYVIECENTDARLERELLAENRNVTDTKSLKDDDVLARQTANNKPFDLSKLAEKSPSSGASSDGDENLADYDDDDDDDADDNGGSMDSNDTLFSLVNSYDRGDESENQPPAETIGTGANRRVYLVTGELSSAWVELASVRPHHIVEARRTRRYFTGKLNHPINCFHRYRVSELDYLRAQIARISASTQVCPRGYYRHFDNDKDTRNHKPTTDQSAISNKTSEKIVRDLIPNEYFTSVPNEKLVDLNSWVHVNPSIGDTGVTTNRKSGPSEPTAAKASNYEGADEIEEEELFEDYEEFDSYRANSSSTGGDLYGSLRDDTAPDKTSAWKSVLCSPFNSRYSCTAVTSHVWPGAHAVAYKSKTDFVYMGWGQKRSFPSVDGFEMENPTEQRPMEFEEVPKKQLTDDSSRKSQKQTDEESEGVDQSDEYNVEIDETFKDITDAY